MDAHLGFFFSQSIQILVNIWGYVVVVLVAHCGEGFITDLVVDDLGLVKSYLLSLFGHERKFDRQNV